MIPSWRRGPSPPRRPGGAPGREHLVLVDEVVAEMTERDARPVMQRGQQSPRSELAREAQEIVTSWRLIFITMKVRMRSGRRPRSAPCRSARNSGRFDDAGQALAGELVERFLGRGVEGDVDAEPRTARRQAFRLCGVSSSPLVTNEKTWPFAVKRCATSTSAGWLNGSPKLSSLTCSQRSRRCEYLSR